MVLGEILAVGAAFFQSLNDVFAKKGTEKVNEYVLAWGTRFLSLPLILPILFFTGMPLLASGFWMTAVVKALLGVVVTILYIRALKHSDISVTVPMTAFTPLFLLVTSPLMVGEFPSPTGLVGVVLLVAGAYLMEVDKRVDGIAAPFRALLERQGPRLMLLVAVIWSVTSNLDKIGVTQSSPLFWVVSTNTLTALFLVPILLYGAEKELDELPRYWKAIGAVGLFKALTMVTQMVALEFTLVAYVIALKRTSILMSVGWGHALFQDENIRQRLAAAALMVVGAVVILVAAL